MCTACVWAFMRPALCLTVSAKIIQSSSHFFCWHRSFMCSQVTQWLPEKFLNPYKAKDIINHLTDEDNRWKQNSCYEIHLYVLYHKEFILVELNTDHIKKKYICIKKNDLQLLFFFNCFLNECFPWGK